MGSLKRQRYSKPLPAGLEVTTDRSGERVARYNGRRVKVITVDGVDRMIVTGRNWIATYRDGLGLRVTQSTGCVDRSAAMTVLTEWERKAQRQRAGMLTPLEIRAEEHSATDVETHIQDWTADLAGKGRTAQHVADMAYKMGRIATECGFRRLADLDRNAVERWLADRFEKDNMPARSLNFFAGTARAFGNWLLRAGRLAVNPFAGIEHRNENADRRHVRRAMTAEELTALLTAAEERPVYEAHLIKKGPRKGQHTDNVSTQAMERARRRGKERALFWRTLAMTGLRFREARQLQIGDLILNGDKPRITLRAESEKARRGAVIPLRRDLADVLAEYLNDRRTSSMGQRGANDGVLQFTRKPDPLSPDGLVFPHAPSSVKVFDADIDFAGIPKHDARGRVLDIHSLRGTFGSMLAASGVPLATAQILMRHSTPTLTMRHYVDPNMLDLAGAVEGLPGLETAQTGDMAKTGEH